MSHLNNRKPDLKAIFIAANELTTSQERSQYLKNVCGDDSELRFQVEQMLFVAESSQANVLDRMQAEVQKALNTIQDKPQVNGLWRGTCSHPTNRRCSFPKSRFNLLRGHMNQVVHPAPNDDLCFAKTVFRIGMLDNNRCPSVCNQNLAPSRVFEDRPRCNGDWAMAFELTPLTKTDTETG